MVASSKEGSAAVDHGNGGWRRDHLARRSLAALGLRPGSSADPVTEAARLLGATARLTRRCALGDLAEALGAISAVALLTILALAHGGAGGQVLERAFVTVLLGVFCMLAALFLAEDARARLVGAHAMQRALAEDRWEDMLRAARSVERGASLPLDV